VENLFDWPTVARCAPLVNCVIIGHRRLEKHNKGWRFFHLPGDAEGWYKNIRTPGHQVEADVGNLNFDV